MNSIFGRSIAGATRNALKYQSRAAFFSTSARAESKNFFTQTSALAKSRHAFAAAPGLGASAKFRSPILNAISKRSYQFDSTGSGSGINWTAIAIGFAGAALAALAVNLFLNGETIVGATMMPAYEAEYLNKTFKWMAGGVAITALSAVMTFRSPSIMRFMFERQILFMIGSVAVCLGAMYAVRATHPETPGHYFFWTAFNVFQGLSLAPLFFFNPALLARAGLYTIAALGGITFVGATAESDRYLWLGGPLLGGLFVLIAVGLTPMIAPRFAFKHFTLLENISIWGGIAIFGAMILYDTQKVRQHARYVQNGMLPYDPPSESISLILDVINLFTRIVLLLVRNEGHSRK